MQLKKNPAAQACIEAASTYVRQDHFYGLLYINMSAHVTLER